jgi:hypothetical protein
MAIAKQKSGRQYERPAQSAPIRSRSKEKLERLYASLQKAKPGSDESKRIADQIVNAIG